VSRLQQKKSDPDLFKYLLGGENGSMVQLDSKCFFSNVGDFF